MSTTTVISYKPNLNNIGKKNLNNIGPSPPSPKQVPFRIHESTFRFCKHKLILRLWGGATSMREAELAKVTSSRATDELQGSESLEEEAILISNGSAEFGTHSISGGGLESTINKMSKWLVAAVFGITILWKHDAEALWAAIGCVLNAWFSVTLKKILNQERPFATMRSDPGMPSSHAQSIFFAVVFAILSMVKFQGLNEVTITIGVLVLAFGSYLSWLRVSQRLHTISQVSVGAIIGTIFSISWFQAWYGFVLKAFIASLWVRIAVVLGSFALCLRFMFYVIQNWLFEEP